MAKAVPVTIGGVEYRSLRAAQNAGVGKLSTLRRGLGLITAERPENRPAYRAVRREQARAARAVKSGRASSLKGLAGRVRKRSVPGREELFEMPAKANGGKASLTVAALAQIDARVARGGIVMARMVFKHYYLSATETDKKGNPVWRVIRNTRIVSLDILRVGLANQLATGGYPFNTPETQLHEDTPTTPSGRLLMAGKDENGKPYYHRDDGGLLSVTLTPRFHTSL